MAPEVVGKVKDILFKYGLPLAGFAGGYFGGDMLKLKEFVTGLIPADVKLDARVISVVIAAIFLGLAVMFWGMWDGVGPFLGGLLAGMGTNLLVTGLKGV
jgi:hypothetical protein